MKFLRKSQLNQNSVSYFRRYGLIVSVTILLGVLNPSIMGQSLQNDILHKTISLQVKNVSLIYVLDKLAKEEGIPIGYEVSRDELYEKKISLDCNNIELDNFLDSVFKDQTKYKWEMIDNVINVTPVQGRHNFLKLLLDLNISNFSPSDPIDIVDLRSNLLKLKEVNELMSKWNVYPSRFVDDPSALNEPLSVGIFLTHPKLKIRDILNQIIKTSEVKMWVLDMSGQDEKALVISF